MRQSAGRGVSPPPRPDPTAGGRGLGLGLRSWHEELVRRLEDVVGALSDEPLDLHLLDRYERALTRGHVDNLRRERHIEKEN